MLQRGRPLSGHVHTKSSARKGRVDCNLPTKQPAKFPKRARPPLQKWGRGRRRFHGRRPHSDLSAVLHDVHPLCVCTVLLGSVRVPGGFRAIHNSVGCHWLVTPRRAPTRSEVNSALMPLFPNPRSAGSSASAVMPWLRETHFKGPAKVRPEPPTAVVVARQPRACSTDPLPSSHCQGHSKLHQIGPGEQGISPRLTGSND